MANVNMIRKSLFRVINSYRVTCLKHQIRTISTSNKNKETSVIPGQPVPPPPGPQTEEEFADVKSQKNWISYGFRYDDKAEDRSAYHTLFFFSVSVCICFGGFTIMYMPDFRNRDWTVREAYLELHRREKLGLPLIDKNFLDPATIELPPEEDLVDADIII